MGTEEALSAFAILLVTIDPLGLAPIFIAVTAHMEAPARAQAALRASAIAFLVLIAFTIGGEQLLRLLHISIPAFQISGGLLLFWISFEMVFEIRSDRKRRTADAAAIESHVLDVAAFPLAIPLIAGPGSIAAAILLSSQHADSAADLTLLCLIEALIIAATYAALLGASLISHALGRTGTIVLTRLLGIVLAALAVEAILTGIRGADQLPP